MNYHISKDRKTLTLTADAEERAELAAQGDEIFSDQETYDTLEHVICNSELQWMNASETGDLTDAPILGIYGAGPNDQTQVVSERWAYMDYQVKTLLEALRDDGKAVLINGE